MGSWMEKDICGYKEADRMFRFLDRLEKMLDCAVPESDKDKADIKAMRGHIKHFRDLFTE